ncbi:MAG: ABC transporter permease [Desulfurococcaceae archaeon]
MGLDLGRSIAWPLRSAALGVISATRFLVRDGVGLAGLSIVLAMTMIAVFVGYLPIPDPNSMDFARFLPPSWSHPFGTDNYGRDVFSRVLWGARVSLAVGLAAALSASLLGSVVGVVAGVWGGWVDEALSRVVEVFMMMPTFFLALVIVVLVGPSIYNIILVIAIASWPAVARVVRAQAMSLRELPYVEAAIALGASRRRIMLRHVLPGLAPLIVSYTVLLVSGAMLTEAGLSYLGLGDPNYPSWGRLIRDGQLLLLRAWWVSAFPGIFLTLTVLGWNFLGDTLVKYANPRRRSGQLSL